MKERMKTEKSHCQFKTIQINIYIIYRHRTIQFRTTQINTSLHSVIVFGIYQ